MTGLSFQTQKTIQPVSPNRMDIACFVGLVNVRPDAPREDIDEWLYQQSWMHSTQGYIATYHRESAHELLDVPVPIDSWERFDQLFAWDQRPFTGKLTGACYLATAVRSFFAQGGRYCYVIRVADLIPFDAGKSERDLIIPSIAPGFPAAVESHPADRSSWHGVGHLLGLPDVSMLCVPDLPDLFKSESIPLDTEIPARPEQQEQFVECSEAVTAEPADNAVQSLPAPVTNNGGYQAWSAAIRQIALFIAEYRREVQLVAAIPLPHPSSDAKQNLLAFMHQQSWFSGALENTHSIASRFVQLCYPWLQTAGSQQLPQGLEPPDGALAGLLARNALSRGAYRSISDLPQNDVLGLYPLLSQQEQLGLRDDAEATDAPRTSLIDRVSLFGFTPTDIALLSDVTTSNFSAHRPANVNRIISMVIRIVRQAGQDYVFENNGEVLWTEITQRLNEVFRLLFDLGALRGKQAKDAFYVRCDRSTMTQQDLDSGRVIVEIHFNPAATIESIEVVLAMQQSGSVSLSTIGMQQAVA
jgi:uncharacterized protein